jgi:fructokinase
VAAGSGKLIADTRFPTTSPGETIGRAVAFFREQSPLIAVGIASFGPVDPNPNSPTFGHITTTPKPGWSHVDLAGQVRQALSVPVSFDTDVNGAALAEGLWGAAQGLDTFVYLTIGTGIGGGGVVNDQVLHGLIHPEMGHMRVPHDWEADPFTGTCPYHGDCLEGLAAGPAIEARWGQRAEALPADHPAWILEATYLALGLVNIITCLSPQRIILGGGVMHQAHLFPLLRRRVQELLNNYVKAPSILAKIDDYIVPPQLGDQAGVWGAIALAQQAT